MSTTTTVLCPLGCGRQVAAEQDEIHYCVTTIRFGRKVATNREYVGTWNGEALFYGACHDEVERQLRPYREGQIAAAGACWEEASEPTQAELREWAIADEAPDGCAACGDAGCAYCDPELAAETPPPPGMATPVEPELPSDPQTLKQYLHTRSISELRSLAQASGVYQPSMRRRVVLIEAICQRCNETGIARPPAPTAAQLIPCSDLDLADPVVVARLAALSPSDLEWQAAVYAAYRSLGSQHVTTAETLADFRRAIAVQRSGAVAQSADAVCHVIFELALTDIPALIAFLRGHTDQQRERVAWRYAAWLRREHDIRREPAFLLRCWDVLLVGASASGMGTDRQAAAMARDNAAVRG